LDIRDGQLHQRLSIRQRGNIIFGGCDGMLHVVSLATVKDPFDGDRNYIAGTAALDGDLAYVGHYGNEVVCANIRTGKVIWTYRTASSHTSPHRP